MLTIGTVAVLLGAALLIGPRAAGVALMAVGVYAVASHVGIAP